MLSPVNSLSGGLIGEGEIKPLTRGPPGAFRPGRISAFREAVTARSRVIRGG